jgi:spermidine synthase
MNKMNKNTVLLLITLFITSFSSLLYEVVWTRQLSHIFGTTAFATTAVLSVFMAGLALGAFYGGRYIENVNKKFQFLALLEIAIGITCLATVFLTNIMSGPYLFLYSLFGSVQYLFYLSLFVLSGLILIIPTFLIGATFPTVVKLYNDENKNIGNSVGITYFFDTFGGALGALITGFFLVVIYGFLHTSIIASILNILIGILLFISYWDTEQKTSEHKEKAIIHDKLILFLFFLSGFAALMFEVIWSRYIALVYGASIHSFSIVLFSFLLGIGIGGIITAKYLYKIKEKVLLFAIVELCIGLFGIFLVILFPGLEKLFLNIFFSSSSYASFNFLLIILCSITIAIPAILMGTTLPILSSIYISENVGKEIGILYSINSMGGIFGAYIAGFIIIPALGLETASFIAGAIYLIIAIIFLYRFAGHIDQKIMQKTYLICFTLVTVTLFIVAIFHQSDYIFRGVYYHGTRQSTPTGIFETGVEKTSELVFKEYSAYGVVTVFRSWDKNNIWLKNSGKTDASLGDMLTQGLLAHAPLALHKNPRTVLDIGMGGGFSMASILSYNSVDSLDVVEIDPIVVKACATVLAPYNNYALNDTRTNIIVADGRNYVASTDKMYDVIISEPPNIWVSGVSSLFTTEFYHAAKAHLKKDGIFSQWFPKYEMSNDDYLTALKTIQSAFPFLYEFDLGGDIIIIASVKKIDVAKDINRNAISQQMVDDDFSYIIYNSEDSDFQYDNPGDYDPYDRNYDYLMNYFGRDYKELDTLLKDHTKISTDDWPILEFTTLRNRYDKFSN